MYTVALRNVATANVFNHPLILMAPLLPTLYQSYRQVCDMMFCVAREDKDDLCILKYKGTIGFIFLTGISILFYLSMHKSKFCTVFSKGSLLILGVQMDAH